MPIPASAPPFAGDAAGGRGETDGASSPRDGKIAPSKPTPFAAGKTSGTHLRRPLVLVVDDHADTREGFAEYLRMNGFRTALAENGVVAIKLTRELAPDAILLDYAMPMMDGVQASLFLKRDDGTRHIPIVMVTAFREHVDGHRACDAYIEKPCEPQAVARTIRSLLGADDGESSRGMP